MRLFYPGFQLTFLLRIILSRSLCEDILGFLLMFPGFLQSYSAENVLAVLSLHVIAVVDDDSLRQLFGEEKIIGGVLSMATAETSER